MCDKSNAMTHAGGLWQRVFKEVSGEHPQIAAQHMYVDALCMQMVRDPRPFDVIVTNNMFGDIITDLAAGLQGGLGMAASGNIHPGKTSMFEPVHGSAPPIAGKNMANPFGAILTAAMMLAHLGLTREAEKIEAAVLEAVRQKKTTQDIGGTLGTREAGEWVAERVSHGYCHPERSEAIRECESLAQSKDPYADSSRQVVAQRRSTDASVIARQDPEYIVRIPGRGCRPLEFREGYIGSEKCAAHSSAQDDCPPHQQCQFPPLPVTIHIHKPNLTQPLQLRFQIQQLVGRIFRFDRVADAVQELFVQRRRRRGYVLQIAEDAAGLSRP